MPDKDQDILKLATEMTGSDELAASWFENQPVPGWDGKTARDLVRDDKADSVLAYLLAVRAGAFA
jgi:hypothetical protein